MYLVTRTDMLLHLLARSLALQDHCCTLKMVGGVTYSLLPSGAFNGEVPARCLNDCVYREYDGAPRDSYRKFCFAAGDLATECLYDPWIAAMDVSGTSGMSPGHCGATLIANNWAVTASHCFFNPMGEQVVTKDTMSPVLGVHDITDPTEPNRQVLTIDEIVLHPSWDTATAANDIALLKLTQSVDLDAWSPACLPTSGADFTGQNGRVYGR